MFSSFSTRLLILGFKHRYKMSVFTQKLNPILGESSWEWQDENYDYQQEIARSSFADMLHDTERNQKYYEALKLAIDTMHGKGKKANVLDIGTGTGLLSMMAVKCGADSVVACEAFLPMTACAQQVTNLNDCGQIKIIPKHSTDLILGEDLLEKANILVTEVFDTELIGEGALSTFSHAHKELLEQDCIVVPNLATMYVQVVESTFSDIWNNIKDIKYKDAILQTPKIIKCCNGAAAVHDIQLSHLSEFTEIIKPTPVLQFDWSGKSPLKFSECNVKNVKAEQDGKAQMIFMWWELGMDIENKIVLSCAPYWAHPLKNKNPDLTNSDIPWRDHWMQAVYYLPQQLTVKKNIELQLIASHDEYSWWFHLNHNNDSICDFPKPICECGFHIAHSRTKIGQINDETRKEKYIKWLSNHVNKNTVLLLISDGFYLGLIASKLGVKKILYLDDNYLSTKVFQEFIQANNLNNVEIVPSIDKLKCHSDIENVNLILAQPHFSTTILPWDSLYFGYLIKKIYGSLKKDVVLGPNRASIKAIVVEFKDLQKIRLPLENCGEFDMKPFDDLIRNSSKNCDANVEAQPLWEYPCIARSLPKQLIDIDLQTIYGSKTTEIKGNIHIEGCRKYNAVALWVEWDFDGTNLISTGPIVEPTVGEQIHWDMHTRQGVHFFHNKTNDVNIEINFNVDDGSINFLFN